jgi:hypothetical protein
MLTSQRLCLYMSKLDFGTRVIFIGFVGFLVVAGAHTAIFSLKSLASALAESRPLASSRESRTAVILSVIERNAAKERMMPRTERLLHQLHTFWVASSVREWPS